MPSKTYEDGADQIVVTTPREETPAAFVEVTRRVKDIRGRWRTEESVAIGLTAWRRIAKDAAS